jgi:hypothetical protein
VSDGLFVFDPEHQGALDRLGQPLEGILLQKSQNANVGSGAFAVFLALLQATAQNHEAIVQLQVFHRRAVVERSRFRFDQRQIVPGFVNGLLTLMASRVLGNATILKEDSDLPHVGPHGHRMVGVTTRRGVIITVEADQADLTHRPCLERPRPRGGRGNGEEVRTFLLESLRNGSLMASADSQELATTTLSQLFVELTPVIKSRHRDKQIPASPVHAVFDMPLLVAARDVAEIRIEEIMPCEILERHVQVAPATSSHLRDRRLQVVVDKASGHAT